MSPQRFAQNHDKHRARGAEATKKTLQGPPEVDWNAACKRVRAMLKRQYAGGAMDGPELAHERIERQEGVSE